MTQIQLPITKARGKYYGQALLSFFNSIEVESIREKILNKSGIEEISPTTWYDLDVARKIYFGAEQFAGPLSIRYIGTKIIKYAIFPEDITSIHEMLVSIIKAYHLNTKGGNLGVIHLKEYSSNSATISFSTPFPCKFEEGIIIGCVMKFGKVPEIVHLHDQCRDHGHESCVYQITW